MKRHEKKLIKFRKNQSKAPQIHKPSFAKCIVHDFSSYHLSDAEITANSNTIVTEFEFFFQNLLRDISNIPECELSKVKAKLRNTCEKYSKVKVPYKHRKIVLKLSKNETIISGVSDGVRGVRKHPPPNIKCPFLNVKCPFLPIFFFFLNQNTLKVFYNFSKFLHDFLK